MFNFQLRCSAISITNYVNYLKYYYANYNDNFISTERVCKDLRCVVINFEANALNQIVRL